jgi:formate hydrogenlyase subunit 3/multisubunit Na+/H+ antiporter MnhD subunit
MALLLAALGVLLAAGLLALATSTAPRLSTALGAAGVSIAALLGLPVAFATLRSGEPLAAAWARPLPFGLLVVGFDRLSAFFAVPLLALAAAAAIYGRSYLLSGGRRPLGPPVFFFNLLVASMLLVLLARDLLTWLVGWELLALSSFLLLSLEHEKPEVQRAGWIYLVASQLGAAGLVSFLLLLARRAGGTDFASFERMVQPAPWPAAGLALLALLACGVKAGLVPVHGWLPGAHAAAPSHLSALMSGASIKVGLYGLLRALSFVRPAAWWGPALLVAGFAGAAYGISQALLQRDLKKVLAYSSIENMGLILMGFGLAYWGRALGDPAVAALGALAAAFHLWSHALMKGLLFLCAGSLLHGAGGRDLEALGGLARRMPWTAAFTTLGAVAIAGLPPLGGFVAEWLLLRGLFLGALAKGGGGGVVALLSVGGLAFVGALASFTFVRLVGIALLGAPRSPAAAAAHESDAGMLGPMLPLAAGVAALALWPGLALAPAAALTAQLFGAAVAAEVLLLAPSLAALGVSSAVLLGSLGLCGLLLRARLGGWAGGEAPARPTWDCGYAAPDARMQVTATSFAQLPTTQLLPAALTARVALDRPNGLFPRGASLRTEAADPITHRLLEPFFARWADRFVGLRWLQQGALQSYLLYILAALVAALAWTALWTGGAR